MTPADRPSVTDDARAEAARRWGDRYTSDRLPMAWHDKGMASGFVLGAQWAADRAGLDRITDLFERWAAEEDEHRQAAAYGIAEGLRIAIEDLREAVHGGVDGAEALIDVNNNNLNGESND